MPLGVILQAPNTKPFSLKPPYLQQVLGEKCMKEGYKAVAEESTYLYQKQAWGGLVRVLDGDYVREEGKGSVGRVVSEKIEAFFKGLSEVCESHFRGVYSIPDVDLREQMREAIVRLLVNAYAEFLDGYLGLLQRKGYPSVERVKGLVGKAFDGGTLKRRTSARNSGSLERDVRSGNGGVDV